MRFVAIGSLKKGMVLAQNIFGEDSRRIYDDGRALSQNDIEKINKFGYQGVYVEDAVTRDIVAEYIIPYDQFTAAKNTLQYFMEMAKRQTDKSRQSEDIERQHSTVTPIIETLKNKKRRIVDFIGGKPYKEYDNFHAVSVMILALLVGIEAGMDDERLYELGVASLLHDIGNAFLPAEILNRPGELTDEEYEIVKRHVQMGYDYLHDYHELSAEASMGALQHHENYDGTGYPNKLKRKQISLVGRIVSVADVYDALVSRRPYRPAKYANEGLDILEQSSDRKFDPDIVDIFMKFIAPYPSGVQVTLTTGEQALVFHNYVESLWRPRLLKLGGKGTDYIDLAKDPELAKVKIRKIVD
ncbi:MAG: HD-GYP domain-containing protein [Oscillospiraceae bacterium]|jgi:HD-GYP domain-containing protein (c-di-GMP phosphodiesterase class II)|nr:HD-GYP domain-containing protein [Oscillospiraceae bacterium]